MLNRHHLKGSFIATFLVVVLFSSSLLAMTESTIDELDTQTEESSLTRAPKSKARTA